ncbi:ATP-binding protein [Pseudohoeflea suaedae]|uniref:ATP-binding protein n=1 Tax=Pseudohoeflea suaedae TaxID=877384 RepID=A0A4R5PMD6_9HYPH|nr:ATP-binding protein [Pseudohoeflea suaedae]TDH38113.1 ATP-binding protein [Pseudohoeflea suaedae]
MSAVPVESEKIHRAQILGERIRQSVEGEALELPLNTSQRIIARVTDGIYREPWAAFRELCANAYDADATRVVIETGAPEFDQITIRDDGAGMSPETLAFVVENIGGSSKRTTEGPMLHTASEGDPDFSPGGRPLIGKIGIGLFAVAQLTQHFQIITKARGENVRSWATVILKTHNESRLKDKPPGSEFEAGRVKIRSEEVPDAEVDAHGTTIILHELRPEIRRLLQSTNMWQAQAERGPNDEPILPPPTYHIGRRQDEKRGLTHLDANLPWKDGLEPLDQFRELVRAASETDASSKKGASLEQLDEYLRSIWKLSLSLPLQYIDQHPFETTGDSGIIFLEVPRTNKRAEITKLAIDETVREHFGLVSGKTDSVDRFDVEFDGILLRRPIKLPAELAVPSRLPAPVMMVGSEIAPFPETSLDRAGGVLRFEAYLYWNSRITPKDIQGSIIRVREASGTLFDARFADYQVSEQSRLRQITAEIFVLEGLDGAINIDRESFNYSHPHYIYIQKWLHRALRLLANRLKHIAGEDLERERREQKTQTAEATLQSAYDIWTSRRGAEADPPFRKTEIPQLPAAVAEASMVWKQEPAADHVTLATSISVVLEAYGVLSDLRQEERAELVNDLIKVMQTHGIK